MPRTGSMTVLMDKTDTTPLPIRVPYDRRVPSPLLNPNVVSGPETYRKIPEINSFTEIML